MSLYILIGILIIVSGFLYSLLEVIRLERNRKKFLSMYSHDSDSDSD